MFRFIKEILREEEGGGGGGGAPPASSGSGSIFGDDPPPAADPAAADPASAPVVVVDNRPPADQVVTKPWHIGFYDENGKINKENLSRLPEDVRKHSKKFERYSSMDELMHGFSQSIALNGKKGDLTAYQRPGEDAPQQMKDDHSNFMKAANNVPDKAEGYGIERPESITQEQWDASGMKDYLDIAHKHSASPELVKELTEFNRGIAEKAISENESNEAAYRSGELAKLQGEHKSQFPEVRAQAERVLSRFGMTTDALGSAENINALYKIAMALGEDKLPSHSSDPSGGITDRQRALAIVNDSNDPLNKAYHDPNHHQHDEAVALKSSLNANWRKSQTK